MCSKGSSRARPATRDGGGEAQLGQAAGDVARAGGGQREVGESGGGAGRGTWTAQSGAEAAHMARTVMAARGRGEQRRGRER
jgi:hypothetical protein